MRAFVFLLVLANLVFFAWTQGYFGRAESPDALRLGQQIAADRLVVLSRDKPPAPRNGNAPAERPADAPGEKAPERAVDKAAEKPVEKAPEKAAEAQPEPARCTAWAGLSARDAEALDAALAGERFAALRRVRHSVPETKSWWVFIPPLANKAEAEKKAGEVRRLGIAEYFIVQEAGPNRYAISLGIFSSEQAAESYLNALRAKGVRSARVGGRPGSGETALTVEASGPAALVEAAVETVRGLLPMARLVACGKG